MEIRTVGGFKEVGKNMSAVRVGDEVVIFDMGLFLPRVIDFEEEGGDITKLTTQGLQHLGAIPDTRAIASWKDKVKAIVLGHCHLDHIGAVVYLASQYNAPICGTPYTIEVLKATAKDNKLILRNPLRVIQPNDRFKVSENIEIELIHVTHSTLQSALVAMHTKEGTLVYANDYKLDNNPTMGKPPNYDRLKQIGQENNVVLINECLYANTEGRTPSESVAKDMLKHVILDIDHSKNAILATSFASHIPRLKTLLELGLQLNRKVVFIGRSLYKYITAAENINLIDFSNRAEIVPYSSWAKKKLKEIEKDGREKYFIICTGGQGEPGAILTKIAYSELPFRLQANDSIIFSNRVIPDPINLGHRSNMEAVLKTKSVRIYKDVHVSGHASRDDLKDLINMLKPKHIIPSHGDLALRKSFVGLAEELGYELGKSIHLMSNGQKIEF